MKKQITLVGTPELSKKVQEAAFSVGYKWVSGDTTPRHTNQPFLLFDVDGVISWDGQSTPAGSQLEILQPCDIIADPSILCGAKKPEEVPPAGYRLVTQEEKSTCFKPDCYAFFNFPEYQWNPIERKGGARKAKMHFKWSYAVPVDCELELIEKPKPEPEFPMFIKVENKKQYDRIQLLCREPDFKPEDGEEYWCCGDITGPDSFDWVGDPIDNYKYTSGNVFRTEAEAQEHIDAVMELGK